MASKSEWAKARVKYESSTCNQSEIAEMLNISRQAVSSRIKKEGWAKLSSVDIVESIDFEHAKPVRGSRSGVRSDENIAVIIDTFALTGNKSMACRQVGISDETLLNWCKDEPILLETMRAARDAHLIGQYKKIASARDWKAAKEILARAPETRAQWGEVKDSGPKIILNIQRDTVVIHD